ncbi:MAG TPA: tripartite tricarboxylate transporter substrate binding protein [Burkholderiales bacterium]|jgi:tripartite-type tricarboxylate transporter receptor subunit TctC
MTSKHWFAFAALTLLISAGSAFAQDFPGKAVRIVIPFPPGGGSDIAVRVIQPRLAERWKQPVVIEPRPGANSTLGTDFVAKSAPDGYTILFTSTQFAYAPSTFAKLPYDPFNDFIPVTLAVTSPQMIFAHPSLPVKTPKELVALARARPGELSLGTPGNVLPAHFFFSSAKVKITPVPYKGAGPMQIDVMGGHVPLGIAAISSVMGTVQSGRVKVIGVCSPERTPLYPSAPPMAEAAPGFQAVAWFGFFLPRGVSPAVVQRIRDDVAEVLKMPAVRTRLNELGGEPTPTSSEEFARWVRSEIERWNKVAKVAGVKPQ